MANEVREIKPELDGRKRRLQEAVASTQDAESRG